MRTRFWLWSSALLWGCAHAPQPNTQPAHAPAATARSPAPLAVFELPTLGLQVRAPAPLELFELDIPLADGPMHTQGVNCTADSQDYSVVRYFRGGRDRAGDDTLLANAKKMFKSVTREAPIRMGEWSGIELEGSDNRERSTWMRVYVVGDGFWVAQVHRSGKTLDRPSAGAFLDSIELRQPWSVHAYPQGHFSVLMPDGGVRVEKKALHAEEFAVAEASVLGGSEGRMFHVWDMPLGDSTATPDERMDRALNALVDEGNRVIWQAPVVVDAARGRDFLVQGKEYWLRLRLIVTPSDLYMLQASARTKQGLLDESVPRFLASLRWF